MDGPWKKGHIGRLVSAVWSAAFVVCISVDSKWRAGWPCQDTDERASGENEWI